MAPTMKISARLFRAVTLAVSATLAVGLLGAQAQMTSNAAPLTDKVTLVSTTAPWLSVRIPGQEYVGVMSGIRIRSNRDIARWRIEFSRTVHRPSGANVTVINGTGKPPYEVHVSWRNNYKTSVHTRVVLRSGKVLNNWKYVTPIWLLSGSISGSSTTTTTSTTSTSTTSIWSSTVYPADTFKALTWVDSATHNQPSVKFTVNLESPYWRSGEDGILRTSGQYKTVTYNGMAYMSSTMADSDMVTVYGEATYTLMPADLPNSTERQTICNDLAFQISAGAIRAMQ